MAFPEFKTKRLLLRHLHAEDEMQIFMLRSSDDVNRFLDRKRSVNIDDAREFIQKIEGMMAKNQAYYWAIVPNGGSHLAGTICLFGHNEKEGTIELGYELLPTYQGKGYMQEATKEIIQFAFAIPGVRKITAVLDKANQPSINLLKKLHFAEDPLAPKDKESPNLVTYKLESKV